MSQKVLAVGDPHARVATIHDILKLAEKIKEQAIQSDVDLIVILGDLFNDFSKIHVLVMRAVVRFFEIILESGKPVRYIIGNHDLINNSVFLEDLHALTPFKNWKGDLMIIDKPYHDEHFVFCPYVYPGRFKEAIGPKVKDFKHTMGASPKAVFCHQEFLGAKMGSITSKIGDIWSDQLPLIVTGHIHDHMWIGNNILCVGAPASQAYGESEDKTISLLSFTDDGFEETRIDLGMPKRLTVQLSVEEAKAYVIPENTYVRINLVDISTKIASFKKTARYDELAAQAKIIPRATDKLYVKPTVSNIGFMEILKASLAAEAEPVKSAFEKLTQKRRADADTSQKL